MSQFRKVQLLLGHDLPFPEQGPICGCDVGAATQDSEGLHPHCRDPACKNNDGCPLCATSEQRRQALVDHQVQSTLDRIDEMTRAYDLDRELFHRKTLAYFMLIGLIFGLLSIYVHKNTTRTPKGPQAEEALTSP